MDSGYAPLIPPPKPSLRAIDSENPEKKLSNPDTKLPTRTASRARLLRQRWLQSAGVPSV